MNNPLIINGFNVEHHNFSNVPRQIYNFTPNTNSYYELHNSQIIKQQVITQESEYASKDDKEWLQEITTILKDKGRNHSKSDIDIEIVNIIRQRYHNDNLKKLNLLKLQQGKLYGLDINNSFYYRPPQRGEWASAREEKVKNLLSNHQIHNPLLVFLVKDIKSTCLYQGTKVELIEIMLLNNAQFIFYYYQ